MVFEAVRDKRAFVGGLTLILVGTYLSVMMAFYFIPGGKALALMQSRWWWEISLNLQVLCFVLMCMCHWERVKTLTGWRRKRAVMRLLVGLVGVSTPACVLVIGAGQDWFRNPPNEMDLAYFTGIVWVIWFAGAYILPPVVALLTGKRQLLTLTTGDTIHLKLQSVAPFILLALIAIEEELRGGPFHYIFWPFLTYLHGAVPYLQKAFRKNQ